MSSPSKTSPKTNNTSSPTLSNNSTNTETPASTSPILKSPMTMMLLGHDPDIKTYHWEGPYGRPFETCPGKLYGWLNGWTRAVLDRSNPDVPGRHLLSPGLRVNEPILYLLNPETEDFRTVEEDQSVFAVVTKVDGSDLMVLPRGCLFVARDNPAAPLEVMMLSQSPYALAGFRGVRRVGWVEGDIG